MKARYLKRGTLEELREAVPDSLASYRTGSFHYLEADQSKYFQVNFDIDEAKVAAFRTPDPQGQLFEENNCLSCYEGLPGLIPYEARDERLWAYLTHTLLLDYTRKRWRIPDDDEAAVSHIRQHFFGKDKRAIERDNATSRLWWMAFLCQRVRELSITEALAVLLYRSDVRANIIERPTASQSIAVFNAIINKLHLSYVAEKKLFDRKFFRPFMIRINSIGGIKLLDCMSEQQMTELIDRVVAFDLGLLSI